MRARSLRVERTDAEAKLWRALRNRQLDGFKFRRQVPVDPYIADFCCKDAKLIIELDGGQHLDQLAYDEARTRRLEACGFQVLRFWNVDVLRETDAVVEDIRRMLHAGS